MASSASLSSLLPGGAAGGSNPLSVDASSRSSGSLGGDDAEGFSKHPPLQRAENLPRMVEAARALLECLGEDTSREGLVKTPLRMAKALLAMTSGYELVRALVRAARRAHASSLPVPSPCPPPLLSRAPPPTDAR